MAYLSMESLLSHSSSFTFAVGAVVVYVAVRAYQALNTNWKLRHIPTVGPSGIVFSYYGAFRFIKDARGMIQEGYEKYHGNAFRIPMMRQWIVVVSGGEKVDELRKASDDIVSFREAINESAQVKYTFGPELVEDNYHHAAIKTTLNRNMGIYFDGIQDELAASFAEHIPATEDWSKIQALPAVMDIICRASNRVFVGLPICRDPDYVKLNNDFSAQVMITCNIFGLFPEVLKPLVALFLTSVPKCIDQCLKHLGPMIQDRLDKDTKYGTDWEGRPNDLISWLLDLAKGPQREVRDLVLRVLHFNFASIHATSTVLTQVIFDLAKHPKYIPALREEIETVIRNEGLTKDSLNKMVKVDSFVKESQRFGGISALAMPRKLLQDFKFSDGLVIPKGTNIFVANAAMHGDEAYYPDPATFDGNRFVKVAENIEVDGFSKHSLVNLRTDYIIFGNGRSGCPGRFFAVTEIKAFIAHLLTNYDIRLDPGAPPLRGLWLNFDTTLDHSASILIRKRKTIS